MMESGLSDLIQNLRSLRPKHERLPYALPEQPLSLQEMVEVFSAVALRHNMTLDNLVGLLDRVSGHVPDLEEFLRGGRMVEWSPEEDEALLRDDTKLLARYKSRDSMQRRREYLAAT
jgi:hypothetical protein